MAHDDDPRFTFGGEFTARVAIKRLSVGQLWGDCPNKIIGGTSPKVNAYGYTLSSIISPLSPSVTVSLFHFQLKTYLFQKSFPPKTLFWLSTDSTDFVTGLFLLSISVLFSSVKSQRSGVKSNRAHHHNVYDMLCKQAACSSCAQ